MGVEVSESLPHCHIWLLGDYFPVKLSHCAWIRFHLIWEGRRNKKTKNGIIRRSTGKQHLPVRIYLLVVLKSNDVMCPVHQTSEVTPQRLPAARPPRPPLLSPGCPSVGSPRGRRPACKTSRALVGKWHLQLNAAGLPCQCALVKYVQCHPVCGPFCHSDRGSKVAHQCITAPCAARIGL